MTIDVDIRAIGESELDMWVRALDASFLQPVPEGAMALREQLFTPGRSLGGFSATECVATLRSLDIHLTVPGDTALTVEGITNVAVVPAQRRRGLLSQMLRVSLDAALARGHCLAALIASEYRIYGRFGFGPATRTVAYDIDVRRAGSIRVPGAGGGSVEATSLEEIRRYGPELHDRFRQTQAGAINRDQVAWRVRTGELGNPYRENRKPWAVLHRDAHGAPAGMALFSVDTTWMRGDPDFTLTVEDLVAVNASASAALWGHLLRTEGVNRVTANSVAPDDPLPLLLDNPPACVPRSGTGQDHLWLRVLDLPRALQGRRYFAPGSITLEVTDRLGYASARFALDVSPDGTASVSSADDQADLTLDVSALGSIYLGDQTFHGLAAAGLVGQRRSGAVARADRMFRTPARPWCPDGF